VPAANDEVERVATPEELTAPVPSCVDPFMKVTVPLGVGPPLSPTTAVNVTDWPTLAGSGVALKLVDVAAAITCKEAADDCAAP